MTTTPTHSGLERLLSVHELSDYLGIPVATLYDWRVDGLLSTVDISVPELLRNNPYYSEPTRNIRHQIL